MLDAIIGLFEGLGAELTTFIISMFPVVELRGAIPAIVNINLIHWGCGITEYELGQWF